MRAGVSRSAFPMNSVPSAFVKFKMGAALARCRFLCTLPLDFKSTPSLSRSGVVGRTRVRAGAGATDSQLKVDWLDSLSCPFYETARHAAVETDQIGRCSQSEWTIGVDPDVSGALALLKEDAFGCTAQVFDTPFLRVLVGKTTRKRLDPRAIVKLIHNFGAPPGTRAYIEQSNPCPKDGKQGWWSGGFTYGLWIGILVASGFSVIPISSRVWKEQFQLYGSSYGKDDSRKSASILFPSMSSSLKRKKDHGIAFMNSICN
ncbi:hypothetical protein AXF42_Ash018859 [Apostasia shenzhenica]|uniref:Uncharacterized protein n=1 Tax=Apostasia shenzhenica TaxID=1088818 RepID=A0A2I0B4Z3_9ASPA|nr:hypothetical protein AXF42_Ash018859 [Apostasia shenzhenica]